jgi:2-hydroxychromene-2-carboxylate isomerase
MATIEFLYDYASPFSFLANELVARRLVGATLEYRPVYLRGFEMFAKGPPYTAPKMSYLMLDLRRCAAEEAIEMRMPSRFPVNGLYALRGALVARRDGCFDAYHTAMFRAAWQQGRDISTREGVAAVATELGLSGVASALDDAAIKDALRVDTEAAVKRGVFGVPTFYVDGEMFWGHDRMHQVARAAGLT